MALGADAGRELGLAGQCVERGDEDGQTDGGTKLLRHVHQARGGARVVGLDLVQRCVRQRHERHAAARHR